jgi:hypothetical protein
MDLGDVGWDGMDWINLAQDRDHMRALVNAVTNLWVYKTLDVLEWLHNWWPLE